MQDFSLLKDSIFDEEKLERIKQLCIVEETNEAYYFKNINKENEQELLFLVTTYLFDNIYKELIMNEFQNNSNFSKAKINKIIKNHLNCYTEKDYLLFCTKLKLEIFLKNNNVINPRAFNLFNMNIIKKEIKTIVLFEINTDGNLLEDSDEDK